jgi:hypothetical protein
MGPIKDVYDLLWYGGLLMGAVIIIWTGYLGVWEWGKECRKAERREEYWRNAFFEIADVAKYFVPELPEPPAGRRRG